MRFPRISLIVLVLSIGLAVPVMAAAHDDDQQYRFEERTYDRMRELAHVLDEQARHAADQAIDSSHHGGRNEGRFLNDITHFARQAADFHRRMDRYRESPWDVPNEINHLTDDARRVDRGIRRAHVFEHTWNDWAEAINVLAQMQRTAVQHGGDRYGDHDRDGDGDRYRDRGFRRY